MKPNLLIVEDERALRESLAVLLHDQGFAVQTAGSCQQALACLGQGNLAVVLLDLRLPDGSGFDVLPEILNQHPNAAVIVATAHASIESAVRALRSGARDYIEKPIEFDALLEKIRLQQQQQDMHRENTLLKNQLSRLSAPRKMVTVSQAMCEVMEQTRRAAERASGLLILGESGCGKELVAREFHRLACGAKGPFVGVNIAAIPAELFESTLFGHIKGAFTGSTASSEGLIRSAAGGTLFLDEIGEMAPSMQAKMLRVLDDGQVLAVGSTRPTQVQFNLVAATNRDLSREVEAGRFRQDLFYRINAITIEVAPLRHRVEDIAPLCEALLQEFAISRRHSCLTLAEDALRALQAYSWPGNVRELRNVLERALLLADGDCIQIKHLSSSITSAVRGANKREHSDSSESPSAPQAGDLNLRRAMDRIEQSMLRRALVAAAGDRGHAAHLLGLSTATFYRKLKQHNILHE